MHLDTVELLAIILANTVWSMLLGYGLGRWMD